MVMDDVPAVGFMVSYAPNACVVAATLHVLLPDHATDDPNTAQTAMLASSALDLRGGSRPSILFGWRINAVSGTRTDRGAAAVPRSWGSRIRTRIRDRATSR